MTEATRLAEIQKLKPCPFCGSKPQSRWNGCLIPGAEDCGYWGIDCIDCCNAQSHTDTEEQAADGWNRRVPFDRIRELEAAHDE